MHREMVWQLGSTNSVALVNHSGISSTSSAGTKLKSLAVLTRRANVELRNRRVLNPHMKWEKGSKGMHKQLT